MLRNEKLLTLLRRECMNSSRKNFRNVNDIFAHVTTDSCSSDSSTYTDSEESDFDEQYNQLKFVEKIDSFDDRTFQMHMRMKRATVQYIISRYTQFLASLRKPSQPAPVNTQCKPSVYMYIWYMGTTASFTQLGKLFGVAKATAWVAVRQVTACINKFGHEFIKWPQGMEVKESQRKFQSKGMPGVIGAVDSTHIEIKAPKIAKQLYANNSLGYSIVLQAVVDGDMKFIDIACGEPGSLHDTEVLQRSEIYKRAQADHGQTFPHNSMILGGPTYPSKSWLVPPFCNGKTLTKSHRKFNRIHSEARVVVEEAFDLLKRRFPRLMKFSEHINLCATTNMVTSACILHNMCIVNNDIDEDLYSVYSYGITSPVFKQNYAVGAEIGINRREELFDQMQEQKLI